MEPSPWEQALGEQFLQLDPRLRAYFGAIPSGAVGDGRGVFRVVGTPRRWLWPLLAVLARDAVLFPVWEREVPFHVRNTPGPSTVAALRRFDFESGSRTMCDLVSVEAGALVDRLGRRGSVVVALVATVDGGALVLRSTRVRLWGIPLPRVLAPHMALVERWDEAGSHQHVSFVLHSALIGRLYEYDGWFDYRIAAAHPREDADDPRAHTR